MKRLFADEICLGQTCIDEEQLKALLEKNNLQPTTNNQQLNSLESSLTPESTEVESRQDEVQPQITLEPTPQPSLEASAGEASAPASTPEITAEPTPELTPQALPSLEETSSSQFIEATASTAPVEEPSSIESQLKSDK